MQPSEAYRKCVNLSNGKRVLIRLLDGQDRLGLIKFFQQAPLEDVQFSKQDVKSPLVIDAWMNQENGHKPLTLVAVDMLTNRVVASLNLSRGQQAANIVGDIEHILLARPFQGLGLGARMLEELIDLAAGAGLHWLKAEVPYDQKNRVKAFQSRGFKIRTILNDYFSDQRGETHDVALMLRPLINEDKDNS
ncbi:MAG: GNAT family N-acetyltransferase [Deltaproteobacteria bacterium]|jgi:ribosomal protein S18 acetylase RimI-like enzyme